VGPTAINPAAAVLSAAVDWQEAACLNMVAAATTAWAKLLRKSELVLFRRAWVMLLRLLPLPFVLFPSNLVVVVQAAWGLRSAQAIAAVAVPVVGTAASVETGPAVAGAAALPIAVVAVPFVEAAASVEAGSDAAGAAALPIAAVAVPVVEIAARVETGPVVAGAAAAAAEVAAVAEAEMHWTQRGMAHRGHLRLQDLRSYSGVLVFVSLFRCRNP